ncbi:hypothetical protein HWI79_3142 [Cryptosporidium felis]|nr:hypothetical protein HWI79_3142 [Cryptosporidium felis]
MKSVNFIQFVFTVFVLINESLRLNSVLGISDVLTAPEQSNSTTETIDSETSTDENSSLIYEQTFNGSVPSFKDQSFYSDRQIMKFEDYTGYLGIITIISNKKQVCRILSGNFFRNNEGTNSFYLFFDTANKVFVGIQVPGPLDFTLIGKLGMVSLLHKNEVFLLNKFILIKADGELLVTHSPWKLGIEISSDLSRMQIAPNDVKNRNIIPPADWDANADSIYPSNIRSIRPLCILTKNTDNEKKLTIPHFSVGTSPTALLLKLNTDEYMAIIVPNNTVFFVDVEDCSIHSSFGHYYNICSGYSVYSRRWLFTNKPWGSRIIIQSNLKKLCEVTKTKLEMLEDTFKVSSSVPKSEKPKIKIRNSMKCKYCRFCNN